MRHEGSVPSGNLTKSIAKWVLLGRNCVATSSPKLIHDSRCFAKAQFFSVSISHLFRHGKSGATAGFQFLWWHPSSRLLHPVTREVGQSNWRRRPRQYARVFVVTTPESVRFLGRWVYPGFVMVFLSPMQSGVTDSLTNEFRLNRPSAMEHCFRPNSTDDQLLFAPNSVAPATK